MPLGTTLLIDSVDIMTTSGTDRFGSPQTSLVASGVPSRVSFKNNLVLTDSGKDAVSNINFTIRVPSGYAINSGDFAVFEGSNYEILEVRVPRDDSRAHHYRLMGRSSSEIS